MKSFDVEASIKKDPFLNQLINLSAQDSLNTLKKKKDKEIIFWELTETREGYIKQISRYDNERGYSFSLTPEEKSGSPLFYSSQIHKKTLL